MSKTKKIMGQRSTQRAFNSLLQDIANENCLAEQFAQKLEDYIKKGFDINIGLQNKEDKSIGPILLYALLSKRFDLADEIFKQGADINAFNCAPVPHGWETAIEYSSVLNEIVKNQLKSYTGGFKAEYIPAIEWLIKRGADVNCTSNKVYNVSTEKSCIKENHDLTAFARLYSLLTETYLSKYSDKIRNLIELFIEAGAKAQVGTRSSVVAEILGNNELFYTEKLQLIKQLEKIDVDFNRMNGRFSPSPLEFLTENIMRYGSMNYSSETMEINKQNQAEYELFELMLKAGADPNFATKDKAYNNYEHTPLHILCEQLENHSNNREETQTIIDLIKLLITHGADIEKADIFGHTPLEYVKIPDRGETIRYLKTFSETIREYDYVEDRDADYNEGCFER